MGSKSTDESPDQTQQQCNITLQFKYDYCDDYCKIRNPTKYG